MKTLKLSAYVAVFFTLFIMSGVSQAYVEDFESGLSSDWLEYTENGWDFVNAYGGEVSMFKQSDGDEIIMLASPEFDMDLYTRLEIDFYGYNLAFNSETVPDLHIGILETTGDFNSFRSIYELTVTNESIETFSIDIGAYKGLGNITFKLVGEKSHIIYLDNFKLYDDAFESNIPIAVSEMDIISANDGSNDVEFRWLNPGFEADGDILTELSNITVRSDGADLLQFDNPNIGEMQTFNGSVEKAGYYKFQIVPVNSFGQGHIVQSNTIWIGLDYPGASTNVVAELENDLVKLTWDKPTEGGNGSYFDGNIESYTITRSDGKEFVVPGDASSFEDLVDTYGSLRYTVQASNSSGIGDPAVSNPLFYVSDEYIYYEDFNFNVTHPQGETSDYDYSWTTQTEVQNSYWTWFSSNFIGNNAGELSWVWTNSGNPDDEVRAVSPVLNTEGFDAISLQFNHYFEGINGSYDVVIETTSDGENWTAVETITITELTQGVFTKTIANADVGSSEFQFGFNRQGPANQNPFMRIDNITLKYQPGVDVRVNALEVERMVEPGTEVSILSIVENNSSLSTSGLVECNIIERFGDQNTVQTYSVAYDDMSIGENIEDTFGPWIAEEGEYLVELSITNTEDDFLSNNIQTTFLNVFELKERNRVVLEEFSGTWCAFCPGAALAIEDLISEGYDIAPITYHRSDDYETEIVETKMDQYGILGFPTTVFDGEAKIADGDLFNSIVDQYRPVVEELQAVKSPISLEFSEANLDGNNYEVLVKLSSYSKIQNPNLKLIGIITESGIEEVWQSLNVLDFVQRNYEEASIDLSTGEDEISFNFEILSEVNIDNSDVVIFVQNGDDLQVLNAELQDGILDIVGGNTNNLNKLKVQVYPNPAKDFLYINMDKAEVALTQFSIYNTFGELLSNGSFKGESTQIDLVDFLPGMYVFEFINGNKRNVKKVIIQ